MNAGTPLISIILYMVAALLGALGQYLYKEGALGVQLSNPLSLISNLRIVLGVACYVAVMLLFVVALKKATVLKVKSKVR